MSALDFQCILFDLDGTLVDTAPDFVQAINQIRAEHNLAEADKQQIRAFVSDGSLKLTQLFLSDIHLPEAEKRTLLLERYQAINGRYAVLFEGYKSFLKLLDQKGIAWGIVTNKPKIYATQLLTHMGLFKRCRVLVCPDDVKISKPDPEGLFLAADTLGIHPHYCIYVGDHLRDIEAGNAASMVTIAANFGYNDGNTASWNADYTINSAVELKPLLFA